jgi:acetyltransferase-like isoleucine patch superfamily enzyme
MIGGGTKIYDTDFHSLEPAIRLGEDNDISTKPVLIKSGAFIGAHCIVLKGVTIGQYSIIGAGSVVTKDIPDWEIWAGNPAKFIRRIKPTIAVSN